MIKNHFKIAGRHLLKSKIYSFINIVGLATGIAVVLLIGLWIGDELSFDHYHRDHRMLAQVMSTNTFNGETETDKSVPIPLAAELRSKYGGDFKRIALTTYEGDHVLSVGEKQIMASGLWAPPEFPEMLSLEMQEGGADGLRDLFLVRLPLRTTSVKPLVGRYRKGGIFQEHFHRTRALLY